MTRVTKEAKVTPWQAPRPTVATVKDVRRLRVCHFCKRIGASLVRCWKGFFIEKGKHCHVHAYCLIVGQKDGWDVFAGLPSEEIGKITMSEWRALGIPYSRVEAAFDAARNREKASGA